MSKALPMLTISGKKSVALECTLYIPYLSQVAGLLVVPLSAYTRNPWWLYHQTQHKVMKKSLNLQQITTYVILSTLCTMVWSHLQTLTIIVQQAQTGLEKETLFSFKLKHTVSSNTHNSLVVL